MTQRPEPCPECRPGLCHVCGHEGPDAVLAPHTGRILCSECFAARLFAKEGNWNPLVTRALSDGGLHSTKREPTDG